MEKDGQIILSSNFEKFIDFFEVNDNLINMHGSILGLLLKYAIVPLLEFLAEYKIIHSYKFHRANLVGFDVEDGANYTYTSGLIPFKYFYPFFAQTEKHFINKFNKNLIIKSKYIDKAKDFMSQFPADADTIFIHIRRGDYTFYSFLGERGGGIMPLSYYNDCINWFVKNTSNPYFIFLTNDPYYVKDCFKHVKNKVISDSFEKYSSIESGYVDFGVMTLCSYGVLSASSYSWWGSYMMDNRIKVFAPKNWLGWRAKCEYPIEISPSHAEQCLITED
jgi:hypothetical protein